MSGSIPGLTTGNFGLMQQMITESTSTSQKLAQLTIQSQTGYVATTYAGLELAQPGSATQTLQLGTQVNQLNNTISNLKVASGQMAVQQSAITTITDIASRALRQFEGVTSLTPQSMATAAATARSALTQIGSLLNSQDGPRYVFAGQDAATAPVPNANQLTSSGFFSSIKTATASLSVSAVFSAAGNPVNSPFSGSLNGNPGATMVAGADGAFITTGILANANGFIGASVGPNTTGSYMQDILTTLSAIGSLTSSQVSNSGFQGFASTISSSLGNAINAMAQDAGALGNSQNLVSTQTTDLQQTSNALTNQLAGADQVNMTQTLSQLSATQTQLQASYQLIASMKTMSLTQYI